jgi:hypothetical protein
MALSKIPYPDHGQGIFLSARCPSHSLDPQIAAALLPSDSTWCRTSPANQASVTADAYI